MKYIPDNSVDMILCDLPYGTTACKWDDIIPFNLLWQQYERVIKSCGAIVLTSCQPFTSALIMSKPILFKYIWVWEKERMGNIFNCKNAPQKDHEDICVFSKGSIANGSNNLMKYTPQGTIPVLINKNNTKKGNINKTVTERPCRQGDYTQTTSNYPRQIIGFKTEVGLHPTQKPVPLFEYLINTYTDLDDIVLDNCIGSGTTAIACINTKRNYIGFEWSPNYPHDTYYNICIDRIQKHKKIFLETFVKTGELE